MIKFAYSHGLGDCSNCAHSLPLYIKRGYSIEVSCTPDKAPLFLAAGATLTDNAPVHNWPHPPAPGAPQTFDHWSGNKSAWNISSSPLPDIGGYWDLWQEYLSVSLSLDNFVTDEVRTKVDAYLDTLRCPLVACHFQGNTSCESKNLSHEQQADTLRGLLDKTDATIVNLDWDNRVWRLNNWRVRHLTDDLWPMSTLELHYLLTQCALLIGIDSGVLHLSRFARCPALGLWTHHHPAHFVLPRPELLNIVPASKNDLTRYRRLAYNIVECPGDRLDGSFIAEQASRMLSSTASDCLLSGLLDKLRTHDSPLTSFVDRHRTMRHFLDLAAQVQAPMILETGCMRAKEDWTAGMSTYLFGLFSRDHGGKLLSVDLDPANVSFARDWTRGLPVTVQEAHSHDCLRSYSGRKIDLLYLDSADVGTPDYQECCLEEAKLSLPHLAERAVIMIDDSPWSCGSFTGKGAKALPWLLSQGFQFSLSGYQAIVTRGSPQGS